MICFRREVLENLVVIVAVVGFLFLFSLVLADPIGPGSSGIDYISNETYSGGTTTTGTLINISGGYLAKFNITATVQNNRWKAFIGWVNGELVLNDASGDKIFDWTLTTTGGKVYATRQSGTVTWAGIGCTDVATMEVENTALAHTSAVDNITATFDDTTHDAFVVAGVSITADNCPTLNTYVDNVSQDVTFEEVVLDDGTNIIYATLVENNQNGFDGQGYDFQMIVPQNASSGSANTPYYVYIEVT